jgi:hypothetical protein
MTEAAAACFQLRWDRPMMLWDEAQSVEANVFDDVSNSM